MDVPPRTQNPTHESGKGSAVFLRLPKAPGNQSHAGMATCEIDGLGPQSHRRDVVSRVGGARAGFLPFAPPRHESYFRRSFERIPNSNPLLTMSFFASGKSLFTASSTSSWRSFNVPALRRPWGISRTRLEASLRLFDRRFGSCSPRRRIWKRSCRRTKAVTAVSARSVRLAVGSPP